MFVFFIFELEKAVFDHFVHTKMYLENHSNFIILKVLFSLITFSFVKPIDCSLDRNFTDAEYFIPHALLCACLLMLDEEQHTVRIDWSAVFSFSSGLYFVSVCACVRTHACVCIAVITIESYMEL
jgi:hypothetical protein